MNFISQLSSFFSETAASFQYILKNNFEMAFVVYGLAFILLVEFIAVARRWDKIPVGKLPLLSSFSFSGLKKRRVFKDDIYNKIIKDYVDRKGGQKDVKSPDPS